MGHLPLEGGTLVVSGVEQGGRPVVSRLQHFEFYGSDGRFSWKRLLELIGSERFAAMATEAGFAVAQLYGDYDRTEFDPSVSPVMIYVMEKPML